MESKDVIRALLWAAVVFFAWQMIATRIWPPPPPGEEPARVADGQTASPGSIDQPEVPADMGVGTPPPTTTEPNEAGLRVVPGEERLVTLGANGDGSIDRFPLHVTLTSVGAGVVHAELDDYQLTVEPDSPNYPLLAESVSPTGETFHSFVTERVHLRDWNTSVSLRDIPWSIESQADDHVVFLATIERNGSPVMHVRKRFALAQQAADIPRHDMAIVYDFENLTAERVNVILTHNGPIGLRREDIRFSDLMLYVGRQSGETVNVSTYTMLDGPADEVYRREDSEKILWSAAGNKYFVAFESPVSLGGETDVDWVAEVRNTPLYADVDGTAHSVLQTVTVPIPVEANARTDLFFDTYLGPKDRNAFTEVQEYITRFYDEQVLASYSRGMCAFMTPKSLTRLMIWLLNGLEAVVRNYGIAIIILVLIVRTILHPVTKKGQVNMMRMQQRMGTLAPKLEEIKKKHPNDKQKQSQETMKLYQEEGVNPMGGMLSSCLPMMLQMPIWIALFTSLSFNIDMRHQPFCLWIDDLTAPDALIDFGREITIPLLSSLTGPITSFNLLPILVSIAMFAQQKLMPKPQPPPTQSDDQAAQAAQMQKMMPYMTLVFGLFFYNMPSGLNLYIGASSFFGMIEQKRIRKHIAELKEKEPPAEKAGTLAKPKKKKGPSFFEKLQKAAEEAQRAQAQNPRKKKAKR